MQRRELPASPVGAFLVSGHSLCYPSPPVQAATPTGTGSIWERRAAVARGCFRVARDFSIIWQLPFYTPAFGALTTSDKATKPELGTMRRSISQRPYLEKIAPRLTFRAAAPTTRE